MARPLKPPHEGRLKKFGLVVADWWAMLSYQEGKCALCLKTFTEKRRPHNDHNHATGEYRGLLCEPCNTKLGLDHEDAGWYFRAWQYLEDPPSRAVFPMCPRRHVDAPPWREAYPS